MKFVVSSTLLLTHLQIIGRVINSKNSMLILDDFLFDIKGKELTITASDSETIVTTTIELIDAEGEGKFAVPAKIMLDPLRELPDQPLTFQINDENLEIFLYFQNGKYNFVGENGDVFPQTKPIDNDATRLTLPAEVLLNGLSSTIFATATEDLRPIMAGVYVDIYSDKVVFVASNGFILSRYFNTTVKPGFESTVSIPKKPASLLKGILSKDDGEIVIEYNDKNIRFHLPNFVLVCRLIEGRFPNYVSVIPQNNTNRLILDRVQFISVLRRMNVFADPATHLVRFDLSTNLLKVSAQSAEFSTAGDETVVCNYVGDTISIGFSAEQMIEILSNITSQEITIDLGDPSIAGIIRPCETGENEDILMLLMPMMFKN